MKSLTGRVISQLLQTSMCVPDRPDSWADCSIPPTIQRRQSTTMPGVWSPGVMGKAKVSLPFAPFKPSVFYFSEIVSSKQTGRRRQGLGEARCCLPRVDYTTVIRYGTRVQSPNKSKALVQHNREAT